MTLLHAFPPILALLYQLIVSISDTISSSLAVLFDINPTWTNLLELRQFGWKLVQLPQNYLA
jgi:hypothetical protein